MLPFESWSFARHPRPATGGGRGDRRPSVAASAAVRSGGGLVLVAALTVDSIGNGLFAPLSLVYFVRLTDVPLPLVGVGCSASSTR